VGISVGVEAPGVASADQARSRWGSSRLRRGSGGTCSASTRASDA
jgi:hypothetical protein